MVSKINVLIVEDESLVAADLKFQLTELGYEVPAIARSCEEALRACAMYQPDLVLMDIRIEGEPDGIVTATRIAEAYDIPIIFLSDLKDKATLDRAKMTASHSFLEKPVTRFTLNTSVEFAIQNHVKKEQPTFDPNDPLSDSVFVRKEGVLQKLISQDILWVKASGSYSEIKTASEVYLQSKNMREVCGRLDSSTFIRVHKSYTINATKIEKIEGMEVSIAGEQIPIGKTYLQAFKARLNII